MPLRSERLSLLLRLGGNFTVVLFVLTLFASVVETQLAQYVQSTLHFRQPFFLFYIVHSSILFAFPLHLLFLVLTTSASLESLLAGLSLAVKIQFAPSSDQDHLVTLRSPFPYFRFLRLTVFLTIGATVPALLWFISVSLSPLIDITAIWNTNAFFAYIITVRLFKLDWELRKLLAVLVATFGVMGVVYGDVGLSKSHPIDHGKSLASASESVKPTAPVVGDLLTLCSAVGYGLYQVLYKRHAALPQDQDFELGGSYAPLPDSDGIPASELSEGPKEVDGLAYPPPFGLHSNLLACGIGWITLLVLWIVLPFLHYSGYERFRLPDNLTVVLSIAVMAASGVIFNVGLLILLGIWGPIVVSVGNLLTIVLVLISDITVGQGIDVITPWNLAGSGAIVVAFGILVYDMVQSPQTHN